SADGLHALSGYKDGVLKLWHLDWELDTPKIEGKRVNEEIKPYLIQFCRKHTPKKQELHPSRKLTPQQRTEYKLDIADATPTWQKQDFEHLMYVLACSGYGWLDQQTVKAQLKQLSGQRTKRLSRNPVPHLAKGDKTGWNTTFERWQLPLFGSITIASLGGIAHVFELDEFLRVIHPKIGVAPPEAMLMIVTLFGFIAMLIEHLSATDDRHNNHLYPLFFTFLAACCMAFSLFEVGWAWLISGMLLLLRPEWQHRPAAVGMLFIACGILFLTPKCSQIITKNENKSIAEIPPAHEYQLKRG
ncbi:MAG: hypothetical protein AAF512_10080, partial [Pseudomonadota bacterium]